MSADERDPSGRRERRLETTGQYGPSPDGEEWKADPARSPVITAHARLCFHTP